MASIIAEIAVDVLTEIISDAEGELIAEEIEALAEIKQTMAESITTQINDGIPQEDALGQQYQNMLNVNPDAANIWVEEMEEGRGIEVNTKVGVDTNGGSPFPNDDEPLSPDDKKNLFKDTDDSTIRQGKFKYWINRIAEGIGKIFTFLGPKVTIALVVVVFAVMTIISFAIFSVLFLISCKIYYMFKKRPSNCPHSVSKWNCNTGRCTTKSCSVANKFRKFLIEHDKLIYAAIVTLFASMTYLFGMQSIPNMVFLGGLSIVSVWLMVGPMGYIVVHGVCGISDVMTVISDIKNI